MKGSTSSLAGKLAGKLKSSNFVPDTPEADMGQGRRKKEVKISPQKEVTRQYIVNLSNKVLFRTMKCLYVNYTTKEGENRKWKIVHIKL